MTDKPSQPVRLAETTVLLVLDPITGPIAKPLSNLALGDELLVVAGGRMCFRRLMMAQEASPPEEAVQISAGSLSPGIPSHSIVLDHRQSIGLPHYPSPIMQAAKVPGTVPCPAVGLWMDIVAEGAERIVAANLCVVAEALAHDSPVRSDQVMSVAETDPQPVHAWNGPQELILLGNVTDGHTAILRFAVPPRTTTVRLSSRSVQPAGDLRRLGVAVISLFIEATEIPLDSPVFVRGFHRAEHDSETTWRWTDGDALLILPPRPAEQVLTLRISDWHRRLPAA